MSVPLSERSLRAAMDTWRGEGLAAALDTLEQEDVVLTAVPKEVGSVACSPELVARVVNAAHGGRLLTPKDTLSVEVVGGIQGPDDAVGLANIPPRAGIDGKGVRISWPIRSGGDNDEAWVVDMHWRPDGSMVLAVGPQCEVASAVNDGVRARIRRDEKVTEEDAWAAETEVAASDLLDGVDQVMWAIRYARPTKIHFWGTDLWPAKALQAAAALLRDAALAASVESLVIDFHEESPGNCGQHVALRGLADAIGALPRLKAIAVPGTRDFAEPLVPLLDGGSFPDLARVTLSGFYAESESEPVQALEGFLYKRAREVLSARIMHEEARGKRARDADGDGGAPAVDERPSQRARSGFCSAE